MATRKRDLKRKQGKQTETKGKTKKAIQTVNRKARAKNTERTPFLATIEHNSKTNVRNVFSIQFFQTRRFYSHANTHANRNTHNRRKAEKKQRKEKRTNEKDQKEDGKSKEEKPKESKAEDTDKDGVKIDSKKENKRKLQELFKKVQKKEVANQAS